jgi:acyl carrier protein
MGMREDILDIFRRIMEAEGDLSPEDSPETVENWDSLRHMRLVLALESAFGLEFSPDDILEIVTLGKIESRIEAKLRAKE